MSESHRPYIARRFSEETERRLKEIRQILNEAEPLPEPSALERLDAEAIIDRAAFKRPALDAIGRHVIIGRH